MFLCSSLVCWITLNAGSLPSYLLLAYGLHVKPIANRESRGWGKVVVLLSRQKIGFVACFCTVLIEQGNRRPNRIFK